MHLLASPVKLLELVTLKAGRCSFQLFVYVLMVPV